MRKFIEMDSAKMGELAKGDEVQVLQHSHALDGTARSEICTVKGARQGWISTKFLSLAAGEAPERPAPEPARGDLKAYAPPVAPAPEGPFSALALEPKRNDGITWNDHQAIMEKPRPIVVPDHVGAAARVCVDHDWDDGPRDHAKRMTRKELAPLHYEALRVAQQQVNGRVLDACAAKRHAHCAVAVGPRPDPGAGVAASGRGPPWRVEAPDGADALIPAKTAARLARLLTFVEKRGGTASALERVPGRV